MPSRSLSRSLNLKESISHDIQRLFDDAYKKKWTSEQTHEVFLNLVYVHQDVARWVISYLEGYYDALSSMVLRSHVSFGKWHEGKFYSVDDPNVDIHEYTEIRKQPGYYWKHDLRKPW